MVHTSTQVSNNQAAPDMVAAPDHTAAAPANAVAGVAQDEAAIAPPVQESSLLSAVVTLWLGFRQRLHSQLQLLLLETQRAAQSLVNMLILALFAALLLISCWLGLLGVGVLLLKSAGLSTLAALSCMLLLNMVALLTCLKLIRRQSSYLCYPASMALLKPKSPDSGQASDD